MQKERKKSEANKVESRSWSGTTRGEPRKNRCCIFHGGGEKPASEKKTRYNSATVEAGWREGGGREERKPAAYSLAFEIDENKLTPFSFLLLFIPWIDGFSSKNFKRVRVVIGFFPPPILFSFFLLTPLNSPLWFQAKQTCSLLYSWSLSYANPWAFFSFLSSPLRRNVENAKRLGESDCVIYTKAGFINLVLIINLRRYRLVRRHCKI